MKVKSFDWSREKNEKLKKEGGISFEEVVDVMIQGKTIDVVSNPSINFPVQKAYIVEVNQYIYYIPFIEEKEKIFLKTIIPSRKLTKKYIRIKK